MLFRFSFCAVACLSLLDRLNDVDVEAAVEFVIACKNFDGGFGTRPGSESHAGQVSSTCSAEKTNLLRKGKEHSTTDLLFGLDSTKQVNLFPIQHEQSSWMLTIKQEVCRTAILPLTKLVSILCLLPTLTSGTDVAELSSHGCLTNIAPVPQHRHR